MPRFRFQWSNLSIELLRALTKELKLLDNNYTESLRSSYGARPKPEFVKDAWQVLLESWLLEDQNAQNNIAEALREKNLGDVTINDNYAYLKTCRNTSNMREVVLAEFIAFAERLAQSNEDSEEKTMTREEESTYVSADGKDGEFSVEEKFIDHCEDSASSPDLDIEAGVHTCIDKAAMFIAEGLENPNHELYQLSGFTALRKDFDHLAVLNVAMELGLISIEGIILYSCLRAYCAKFLRKYLCMQHNNFMVDAGIKVSERTLMAIDQAQEYLTWHADEIVQQQSDGALRNLQHQSSNDQV